MGDTLGSAMSELWDVWQPEELERVARIERAVTAIADGGLSEPERRFAQEEAHRLAGSLAALGVGDGARCARELERRLIIAPERHHAEALAMLVAALRAAVEQRRR